MGQFVHIKGTQPQAQVWAFFSMPDLTDKYMNSPMTYIRHVLGYGGEDSLGYFLREDLGLINDIDVAADMSSAGTSFWVVFSLTPEGQKKTDQVLDTMFMYMHKMIKQGVNMKLYKS